MRDRTAVRRRDSVARCCWQACWTVDRPHPGAAPGAAAYIQHARPRLQPVRQQLKRVGVHTAGEGVGTEGVACAGVQVRRAGRRPGRGPGAARHAHSRPSQRSLRRGDGGAMPDALWRVQIRKLRVEGGGERRVMQAGGRVGGWVRGARALAGLHSCRRVLLLHAAARTPEPGCHPQPAGPPALLHSLPLSRASGVSVKCARSMERSTRSTSGLCTTPSCGVQGVMARAAGEH